MIAIYCRISVDRDNQKSIKEQQQRGKEFADSIGSPFEYYVDQGISGGGKIEDRPEFERLVFDLDSGTIKGLWVWNADRTQREEIIWFTLADLLIKKGIDFYEDGKLIDLNDPNTFFLYGIKSQMDAMYKRVTSKKIKAVLKRNAQEGKAHAKVMPFGYMKDSEGYLVVNEEEAEIVKEIYVKSLSGIGSSTIKKWLNETGIPTRYSTLGGTLTTTNRFTGKKTVKEKKDIKWSDKQVQDILRNPIYKGKRKWGKEYYDCPAIFDSDYWQKVNDNLPKNRKHSGKKVDHLYLLKGLLECGRCGRNIYGRKRANLKDNAYICSSKRIPSENCKSRGINIDFLEDIIFSRFLKGDRLLRIVKSSLEDDTSRNRVGELLLERETLQKKIQKLHEQRKKAIRLTLMDEIKEEDIEPELKRIRQEVSDMEAKLTNVKEDLEFLARSDAMKADIQTDIDSIRENTPFNTKRDLIHKYIRRIIISHWEELGEHVIEIRFNIPVRTEMFVTNRKGRIAQYASQLEDMGFEEIEGIWYGNMLSLNS
ncbi:recombinase family protein [Maribacter sp. 2307UL18-2]|uniref:recombinase family protein n=1 Tax=Maribacter sp. 2307UL18-2 TaxID=3386274 RepID=UPI0039BCF491